MTDGPHRRDHPNHLVGQEVESTKYIGVGEQPVALMIRCLTVDKDGELVVLSRNVATGKPITDTDCQQAIDAVSGGNRQGDGFLFQTRAELGGSPTPMDFEITKPSLLIVTSTFPNLRFDTPCITPKQSIIDPNCGNPRLYLGRRIMVWYSSFDKDVDQDDWHPDRRSYFHNFHMFLWDEILKRSLPIILDPGNKNGGTGD